MTVYFIKPINMDGPIKIGCSKMPGRRLTSLQKWCPFPLEIVAEISGDKIVEARFHRRFLDSHLQAEWFEVTPDLIATISQINAGTYDIDSLPKYGGSLSTIKSSRADYTSVDLQYFELHQQFLTLPHTAQWVVRRKYRLTPSISAFLQFKHETKVRHIAMMSDALEIAAA